MKSIYVAIPSLDDTELVPTVLNAFAAAKHPERVFVGVSLLAKDKWRQKDFLNATKKYKDNIRFEYIHLNKKTKSMLLVGNGRRRVINLYSGQDYFLQVDAHAMFAQDWDADLIDTHEKACSFVKNDKVVLTAYSGYYTYDDDGKRFFCDLEERRMVENGWLHCPYYVSGLFYHDTIPRWDLIPPHIMKTLEPGTFVPVIKFNANFAFSSGDFAANSGLYDNAEFFEEEVLQTINLIKLGYTLVYPVLKDPIIGHLYGTYMRASYGRRLSKADYIEKDEDKMSTNISINNYRSYLKDPANRDAIDIYEKYTKMKLNLGPSKTVFLFPDHFLNSNVLYQQ